MKIDCKNIAEEILNKLEKLPKIEKFFAVFLISEDPSSASFVKQKEKIAKRLGIDFRVYNFSADIENDKLREEIGKIVSHKNCGGAIVQLPLPSHLNSQYILNAIPREKDVDVLTERAVGAFYYERNKILPPAVGVVNKLCEKENCDLSNMTVCVAGLGGLVGKPVSNWIMRKAKQTILLRSVSDFSLINNADLLITGIGKAGIIKSSMFNKNVIVIDFGYDRVLSDDGKNYIKGDFYSDDLKDDTKILFTPTPYGTGPILVAKLFENFYSLCE